MAILFDDERMSKLLLTSTGFDNPNIGSRCKELLREEPHRARVLFVPTAMECPQADGFRAKHARECLGHLRSIGIRKDRIVTFDSREAMRMDRIRGIDMVYVSGGHTYYLLRRLRETHFDTAIVELVGGGALYVGVSAGSILAGPDISVASVYDSLNFVLRNTMGLRLTRLVVAPHFTEEKEQGIRGFERENGIDVTRITDSQAVIEVDGKASIIG
jgi:dipeptidase E